MWYNVEDMKKHRSTRRRYSRRRRGGSLSASNWGPVLALLGTVLGILAVLALIVFVAVPKLMPILGIEATLPWQPTPSPSPTPRPTPTPNPMTSFDPIESQSEVVFSQSTNYQWFGDPYFYDDKLIMSAGVLIDSNAVMQTLISYDPEPRTAEVIDLTPANTHFIYPQFNDKWLIYLDANMNGGGYITAVDLTAGTLEPVIVKEVYTGQPEIKLSGDYIAWIDRTGTRMDKLFVCDLTTMETACVRMFSNSVYGQSLPSLIGDVLVWADNEEMDTGAGSASSVFYMDLHESTVHSFSPGTYVHDPEGDGEYFAWLDNHHAEGTKLYCSRGGASAVLIDENVVEFGFSKSFIAYSKEDTIWVYMLSDNTSYRVTPEREKAQFLGVSDSKVIWMDVTSRERDIVKFAPIP